MLFLFIMYKNKFLLNECMFGNGKKNTEYKGLMVGINS